MSMPAPQNKKKRKEPPSTQNGGRSFKRSRHFDARVIRTQPTDAAFNNGELNVERFIKAREFEIAALEDGIKRAKHTLSTRAHQELPKELRRRTASHNAKRVPKRLRQRAKKEMVEDNTPTVTARRRKLSGHQRLRLETAQRLQKLSKKSKQRRSEKRSRRHDSEIKVIAEEAERCAASGEIPKPVKPRRPKIRDAKLREPPLPPAKFRKRQISKTWLPTHLWHSKRARMTAPMEPMWKFALPLTPIVKSYRNTHRSLTSRGAIAWDMSYISTISIDGAEASCCGLLKALGFGASDVNCNIWGIRGAKWRAGARAYTSWVHERDKPSALIAPVTVLWCPIAPSNAEVGQISAKVRRRAFLRVHPSAFMILWAQVVRLAKVQKPSLIVEDLRFEIGSIEISGPDASEALVATLQPRYEPKDTDAASSSHTSRYNHLSRIPPSGLPDGTVLSLDALDPRLRYPPRKVAQPKVSGDDMELAELLVSWSSQLPTTASPIFDRNARLKASRQLPSQQSINRRKGDADPGEYPEVLPTDPAIPIVILSSGCSNHSSGTWTMLLPWKCMTPVWYSLVHYPLSSGGNIRFGGVTEQRQLAYEAGVPWFPADFPATLAGQQWEFEESKKRKWAWDRMPRGRRVDYESIDLGEGRKGEIGEGWSCDWHALTRQFTQQTDAEVQDAADAPDAPDAEESREAQRPTTSEPLHQITHALARRAMAVSSIDSLPLNALVTIKLTMLSRGKPSDCARIYRLPTGNTSLRQKWLAQVPSPSSARSKARKSRLPLRPAHDAPAAAHRAWLAASILYEPPAPGSKEYPVVPDAADLIGFVTTGNFSLREGKGVGIGSVLMERLILAGVGAGSGEERHIERGVRDGMKVKREQNLIVVRDAGETHGRLAEFVFV